MATCVPRNVRDACRLPLVLGRIDQLVRLPFRRCWRHGFSTRRSHLTSGSRILVLTRLGRGRARLQLLAHLYSFQKNERHQIGADLQRQFAILDGRLSYRRYSLLSNGSGLFGGRFRMGSANYPCDPHPSRPTLRSIRSHLTRMRHWPPELIFKIPTDISSRLHQRIEQTPISSFVANAASHYCGVNAQPVRQF